jgi:hypothetical protein
MAIGPDGRIIRRRVRYFTPVNTNTPSEKTGFFLGLISSLIVGGIVVLIFAILGWLGDWLLDLKWWNASNFTIAGFWINLVIFPIYVSGVLEGLSTYRLGRFRFYAFLYGTIAISILILIDSLPGLNMNYWNFAFAAAYGIYTMWFATKMVR